MENEQENENKPKIKARIYEDPTQIQQFVEPEWMKILKNIIENGQKNKLPAV